MKRKVFALSSLIVFIVLCSIRLTSDKEITQLVFNQSDRYYYGYYLIDTSKSNITTKNILDFLDNIKITKIYPNTNPLYRNFINISEYKFNEILSSKKNISNFISVYNDKLKENALIKEIETFNISGVKLNKIKVYASKEQIENLLSVNPEFVIEETSENY